MGEVKTPVPARVHQPHRRGGGVPRAGRGAHQVDRAHPAAAAREPAGAHGVRLRDLGCRGDRGGEGGLRPGVRRAAAQARDPVGDREPAVQGDPRRPLTRRRTRSSSTGAADACAFDKSPAKAGGLSALEGGAPADAWMRFRACWRACRRSGPASTPPRRRCATLPGHVLEVGLGKGRTYDRLRTLFPQRAIYAFDRELHCPARLRPRRGAALPRRLS